MSADFVLIDHGSILILNALSDDARAWVDKHLPDDRQTWGRDGTVIEPRYIGPIVEGITDDGLLIKPV